MPAFDAKLILSILGPLFLLFGLASCLKAGAFVGSGRTWLLVGGMFVMVAAWLWFGAARA